MVRWMGVEFMVPAKNKSCSALIPKSLFLCRVSESDSSKHKWWVKLLKCSAVEAEQPNVWTALHKRPPQAYQGPHERVCSYVGLFLFALASSSRKEIKNLFLVQKEWIARPGWTTQIWYYYTPDLSPGPPRTDNYSQSPLPNGYLETIRLPLPTPQRLIPYTAFLLGSASELCSHPQQRSRAERSGGNVVSVNGSGWSKLPVGFQNRF